MRQLPEILSGILPDMNLAALRRSYSLKSRQVFWLLLSLAVCIYYGATSIGYSFSQPYIIQDDARLHIVWLQQLVDPALFPQDAIAQYYQTIQGAGFRLIYQLAAGLGIEPLLFAKVLPLLLGLITTVYLFYLTLELWPIPVCGFLATLLLHQNIWFKDDLISASPRSLIYPLLCAFLYYLLNRAIWPLLITIGLMGWIYPQLVLVQIGCLLLWLGWTEGWRLDALFRRSNWRSNYGVVLAALVIAAITVLPFQLKVQAAYGSIAAAAQMQQMPEFNLGGRRAYFGVNPWQFVFAGASGLRFPLFPPILWLSLVLPIWRLPRSSDPSATLAPLYARAVRFLLLLGAVSIGLWGAAHLLFPRLYLPSRYTFYTLRIGMALAAGIVLGRIAQAGWRYWQRFDRHSWPQQVGAGLAIGLGLVVAIVPAVPPLFLSGQGWVVGHYPAIYQFFAQQPADQVIGSLTPEADNIPAFAARSVWVSREFSLAYHPSFYQQMQERTIALLQIHYSPDLATVQRLLQQQGIDWLLIDRQFVDPDYLSQQDWLIHSSFQAQVLAHQMALQQGTTPALRGAIDRCTALSEDNLIILQSQCIDQLQSKIIHKITLNK